MAYAVVRELRAELRKMGLPTTGRKRELERRLEDAARNKELGQGAAASSIEEAEDEVIQGAEKPDRMKEVRKIYVLKKTSSGSHHCIYCWTLASRLKKALFQTSY